LKFVNAKPVYFPPMANNSKWASDNGGSTSYKTAAYRDKDGSLGGGPNSYVLINDGVNDSIAVDADACEIKPTWNAAVCKGDIGRLSFGGGGGFGGFGGARGAGAARGAAAGPGAANGPGVGAGRGGPGTPGGRFGAPAGPPQPPVVLSRNGKDFTVTGGTTVRAGTEIKVTTERPSVPLTLTELDRGSWVIFELPGFTTAGSGEAQNSLEALRAASTTSYYKGQGSLWVKVVSTGDSGTGAPGGGTSVQVSR
jgi:cell migration-inducing and hyaluronan-binding protein